MERLTIPDKKVEGGWERTVVDPKEVKKYAMTIYWALKKYEDTGLMPEQIRQIDDLYAEKCREVAELRKAQGWISVEERLPETGKRCLVKMKHHAWISDYDTEWIPDNEKVYHAEYTETCEAIYQGDGDWSYYDLECGESTAFTSPHPSLSMPIDEVLEWKYIDQMQPEQAAAQRPEWKDRMLHTFLGGHT